MLLPLLIVLSSVASPPAEDDVLGTLVFGPEAMYFVECGGTEKLWLNGLSLKSPGWEAVNYVLEAQPRCDLDQLPCTPQRVIVMGRARKSQPGNYGHLSEYERDITFVRIGVGSQKELERCESET